MPENVIRPDNEKPVVGTLVETDESKPAESPMVPTDFIEQKQQKEDEAGLVPSASEEKGQAATPDWYDANLARNFVVLGLGIILIAILTFMILNLRERGLASNSYQFVSDISNQAGMLGWLIAGLSGFMLAFFVTHPTTPPQLGPHHSMSLLWVIGIIVGLLAGVFPGLILIMIALSRGVIRLGKRQYSRPTKPGPLLAVFSFLLGVVPGFILMVILTYPLSSHACRLSGSKYC